MDRLCSSQLNIMLARCTKCTLCMCARKSGCSYNVHVHVQGIKVLKFHAIMPKAGNIHVHVNRELEMCSSRSRRDSEPDEVRQERLALS